MPVLTNQRHERYAQELAKGKSADEAYEAAGFKPNRGNASRLKANEIVGRRVAELQADIANRTAEKLSVTRTGVIEELAKIGFVAVKNENIKPSDKRAALLNLAQIEGWVVERHQHSGPNGGPIKHDLTGLPDEQLTQLRSIIGSLALVGGDRRRDPAEGGGSER